MIAEFELSGESAMIGCFDVLNDVENTLQFDGHKNSYVGLDFWAVRFLISGLGLD